jgi:acetoin utilization protein AcuC
VVDVVPRSWTHLLAAVGGVAIDPADETPAEWRRYVEGTLGRPAPLRMTDGRDPAYRDWADGYDPGTWLDRAIHETRSAVFPDHGLDPLP